jgi:hypothetical protein
MAKFQAPISHPTHWPKILSSQLRTFGRMYLMNATWRTQSQPVPSVTAPVINRSRSEFIFKSQSKQYIWLFSHITCVDRGCHLLSLRLNGLMHRWCKLTLHVQADTTCTSDPRSDRQNETPNSENKNSMKKDDSVPVCSLTYQNSQKSILPSA